MRAVVILLVATATAARAQPVAPWTFDIEPRVGVLESKSKLDASLLGGFELGLELPHDGLLGLEASFTHPHHTGTVIDDDVTTSYTLEQSQILLAITVNYRFFDSTHRWVPHVGLGPLVQVLLNSETTTAAPGVFTANEVQLGAEAGGGLDVRVGPGWIAANIQFVYSRPMSACAILPIYIPLCSAHSAPLTGGDDVYNIAITGGYRVPF